VGTASPAEVRRPPATRSVPSAHQTRACPATRRARSIHPARSACRVARVAWDGENPWTATQLLDAQVRSLADSGESLSAFGAARAWLRETLAAGPRLAQELRQEATACGIGEKALYAARKAEGVTGSKERVPYGRWFWMLTPNAGDNGEDGTPPSP